METSSRGSPEGVEREDAGYEPFELQPSLLDTVSDVCPAGEEEEIWRVVGPSLAEQARDLLDEARIHLEIWRELKEDADHETSRGLPEPPMVRERLIQEIRFLANHLKTRAGSSTLECSRRGGQVINYALTTTDLRSGGCVSQCGRPQSAVSSSDGRDTPLRRATPSSQDGSQSSVLSSGSGSIVENVSLTDIDSTVQHLRELLEEEVSQRKQDIVFLQECSERERTFLHTNTPPPSLRELREVGTLLEREAMSGTNRGTPQFPPPRDLVFPRPPPGPVKSPTSSGARLRRASGIKPCPLQSTPTPVISRTNETRTLRPGARSDIISPSSRYNTATSIHTTTTHCTSIT